MAGERQSRKHPSAVWMSGVVAEVDGLALASLVAFALDQLSTDACCPHSCAACASLVEIEAAGGLDDAVRPYVRVSKSEPDWWRADADSVDWSWVEARWCDPDDCD